MSGIPRSLVAQSVICGVGVIGVSMGVLEPLNRANEDAMLRLEQAQRLAAHASEYALLAPAQAAESASVEKRLAEIAERSAPARDAAKLNAAIESLASKAGVAVQRTQPRAAPDLAPSAPSGEDAEASAPVTPDAALGFTIDAAGSFAGMARFVRALETDLGYTVVASVRLTPESERRDLIRASITTQHFAFSLPKPAPGAGSGEGVASAEGAQ